MKVKIYLIFLTILILGILLIPLRGSKEDRFLQAATDGNVKEVKTLLVKGVDVNTQDKSSTKFIIHTADEYKAEVIKGATALMMACQNGHTEVVKVLLEAKANVNIINDYLTALYVAVQEGHLDIVKSLLEVGADVNVKNACGDTVLMKAVTKNNVQIVKALLEAGADANIQHESFKTTALYYASWHGYTDIVKLLKEYGAKE